MKNLQPTIDYFLKISRWNFFSEHQAKLKIVAETLLPMFEKKIKPLKKIVDLTKPFSMADFYKICKAKNIIVFKSEELPFKTKRCEKPLGFYYFLPNCNQPYIWIRTKQSKKDTLHTAAHELSHHLLRHLRGSKTTPASSFFFNKKLGSDSDKEVFAELEADLMTSFLLTLGGQNGQ